MADLKSASRWEKYVPNIGENRDLPKPFHLRIRSNLTRVELGEYLQRYEAYAAKKEHQDEAAEFAAVFEGVVEMGDEPLSIRGQPVEGLRGYFGVLLGLTGVDLVLELVEEVARRNSVKGTQELFFERLSGGRSGTGPAPGTAAASSGSGTKP